MFNYNLFNLSNTGLSFLLWEIPAFFIEYFMWTNFIWGFSFVCGRASLCSLGWIETHYVAQVEFELKVTLPPECWD